MFNILEFMKNSFIVDASLANKHLVFRFQRHYIYIYIYMPENVLHLLSFVMICLFLTYSDYWGEGGGV